nr:cytochrome c [Aquibium oceanicum]
MNTNHTMRLAVGAIYLAGTLVGMASSAFAEDQVAYGKALVETNCARCHAVGASDESTHPEAPPFRTLSERYPLDALEEAFVEGVSTGHPDMPEFKASPEQIGAIIDYMDTLQPK